MRITAYWSARTAPIPAKLTDPTRSSEGVDSLAVCVDGLLIADEETSLSKSRVDR